MAALHLLIKMFLFTKNCVLLLGTFVYYAITVESATDIITANSTDKDVARLFVNVVCTELVI